MISEPLRALGPLQHRRRAIQPLPRERPSPDMVAAYTHASWSDGSDD